MDPANQELKEAADSMDGFAEFYEKRGIKRGKKLGKKLGIQLGIAEGAMKKVIEQVKEGMNGGLTDAAMVKYFCITPEELDEIKELIERYPDGRAQELAEIYMEKQEELQEQLEEESDAL